MTEHRPLNTAHERVKLKVEDYLLLDRAGAFADYAKTELLAGEIYFMNAQHRPHARIKSRLHLAIAEALRTAGSPLEALVEASILIPDDGAPEPDIVVTSEPEGEGLIPVSSVALVVEVADTTLKTDLGVKVRTYAAAGVPEYWVVDVDTRVTHQMWGPEGEAYAERREVAFGQLIEAATVEGLAAALPIP